MTEAERIAQLEAEKAQVEAEKAALEAEKRTLEENQRNQNAYITKLEAQRNAAPQEQTPPPAAQAPAMDPALTAFLKKQMDREILAEKEAILASGISKYKALISEPEWLAIEKEALDFINATMNEKNQSENYVIDACSLIYGRAVAQPEHALNKLRATPAATHAPVGAEKLKEIFTPGMSNKDQSASSDIPGSNPGANAIKNTGQAIDALKQRFMNANANKYQ